MIESYYLQFTLSQNDFLQQAFLRRVSQNVLTQNLWTLSFLIDTLEGVQYHQVRYIHTYYISILGSMREQDCFLTFLYDIHP